MKLVIEDKCLSEIVNYLATKPFREVAHLMRMIEGNCKPLEEPKQEEKKES